MSVLLVSQNTDFISLRDTLDVTDGNLASHLKALEEAEYIAVTKRFINRKPNTTYSVTSLGTEAFKNHLNALELLISRK